MNRRNFLTRVSAGLIMACSAAHLGTNWLPNKVRRTGAIDFMTKMFNKHMKGRGAASLPREMYASKELYDAYESELTVVQRFTSTEAGVENLYFKGTTLYKLGVPGWSLLIQGKSYDLSDWKS